MRRLVVLALAVLPLVACSGEQGERAQQLLTSAEAAQARLSSASFEAKVAFSMDGRRFGLAVDGGGYFKGRREGDSVFSLRADGIPGAGSFNMQGVVRRGQLSMTLNGQRFSAPQASTAPQLDWSGTMLDLARYVKDVRVLEGRVVNGERGATIAGVIDTKELLKAVAKLDTLTRAAKLDDFDGKIGDIHAAVFVAARTGLIRSAAVNLKLEVEGKKMAIDFTYRMKSANKAVAGL
jgi:hypothetical protein